MTRILETDENGALTIPAELLGAPAPRARYVVASKGRGIQVEPEAAEPAANMSHDEWLRQWRMLGEEIAREWKSDKSAAEVVSEMRR